MKNRRANLDHLNLTVKNFEETARWYERVFGFELVEQGIEEDGPWGILRNGDSMLCVYESPNRTILSRGSEESEKLHHIYHFGLRIDDEKAFVETLAREKICTYYGGPVEYPHSKSWYVLDPSGYMIEVALWGHGGVRFD